MANQIYFLLIWDLFSLNKFIGISVLNLINQIICFHFLGVLIMLEFLFFFQDHNYISTLFSVSSLKEYIPLIKIIEYPEIK